MKITKETDHAVNCVLYLAVRRFDFVSVSEIAEGYKIPKAFLSKIFQKLVKADLVHSRQGKKGGFRLSKKPRDISLLDVYIAIHGELAINVCLSQDGSCDRSPFCGIKSVWNEINQIIKERLKKINFADLAQKEIDRLYGRVQKQVITQIGE